MKIVLNGEARDIRAARLSDVLDELGFAANIVATALNGSFVPALARNGVELAEGDRLEVVSPRQGG
jgi:sulfur carrier protein